MRRAPLLEISDATSPRYERRRPEQTVLYKIVAAHLETFLAEVGAHDGRGLPRYVEKELRAYLRCGILAHGFLRASCKSCGEELVVAFSCKRRGVCPSCNARRMCSTAAHLVDSVLPDVPVRQWVLSVPYELRLTLARRADAFGALTRIFSREVLRWQRLVSAMPAPRGGGVTFPQRFGGSLNLNTHVHAVFPDGVFVRDGDARAEFIRIRAPTSLELSMLCERIHAKMVRWLDKRGLLRSDDDISNESPRVSCLDACAQTALGMGVLAEVKDSGATSAQGDEQRLPRPRKGKYVGEALGFGIHAGVSIAAGDALGRERLFRYCTRPPLCLERLSVLPDGRIAYRLKAPWRKDQTHRVMAPVEFIARLAALVPPPRHPLIQFQGVFAPNSAWRSSVVPAATHRTTEPCSADTKPPNPTAHPTATCGGKSDAAEPEPPASALPADTPVAPAPPPRVAHAAAPRWIDWATLLKRVYDIDVLACPCGGRLRFKEVIDEREHAAKILRRLGLPAEPPIIARARAPTDDDPPDPQTWIDPQPPDDLDPA